MVEQEEKYPPEVQEAMDKVNAYMEEALASTSFIGAPVDIEAIREATEKMIKQTITRLKLPEKNELCDYDFKVEEGTEDNVIKASIIPKTIATYLMGIGLPGDAVKALGKAEYEIAPGCTIVQAEGAVKLKLDTRLSNLKMELVVPEEEKK